MKILKIVGGLVGVLLVAGLGFYGYMGGFKSVSVEPGEWGPVELIYSTHKGSYEGLSKSWEAFMKELAEANYGECLSLSVYLDPPETPAEELRTIIGCDISALEPEKKKSIQEQFPSFVLPKVEAMVGKFPYKNPLSFMLGPQKVYPKMNEVLEGSKPMQSVAIEEYGKVEDIKEIVYVLPYRTDVIEYAPLFQAFDPTS